MFKSLSFDEAFEFLLGCHSIVSSLESYFGEAAMEVIHDALNYYAQTPALWSCDEDGDLAALMAYEFSRCGFNHLKPEFDVTQQFMKPSRDV